MSTYTVPQVKEVSTELVYQKKKCLVKSGKDSNCFVWCKIINLTADEPICVCRHTYIRGFQQPAAFYNETIRKSDCQELGENYAGVSRFPLSCTTYGQGKSLFENGSGQEVIYFSVPLCSMKPVSTRQLGVNAEFIMYLCLPSGFFRLFQHFLHAA